MSNIVLLFLSVVVLHWFQFCEFQPSISLPIRLFLILITVVCVNLLRFSSGCCCLGACIS
jgi:hypothetical protein